MIAHSDNTATNAAPGRVGADRERALVARAELPSIRIPGTTRIFQTYVAGALPGADLGWPAIAQAFQNLPRPLRPLLNDVATFAATARDFVAWYEQALWVALFAEPETLTECKRIQAGSKQIARAVPHDTPPFAKGGEVTCDGFNAKSFAGQIVVGGREARAPITFCSS